MLKSFAFHTLKTFRWIFVPIAKFISAVFCIVTLVSMFSGKDHFTGHFLSYFFTALLFGGFAWYYDLLIKKLSPVEQTNQPWS